jgi:hypothetical protein
MESVLYTFLSRIPVSPWAKPSIYIKQERRGDIRVDLNVIFTWYRELSSQVHIPDRTIAVAALQRSSSSQSPSLLQRSSSPRAHSQPRHHGLVVEQQYESRRPALGKTDASKLPDLAGSDLARYPWSSARWNRRSPAKQLTQPPADKEKEPTLVSNPEYATWLARDQIVLSYLTGRKSLIDAPATYAPQKQFLWRTGHGAPQKYLIFVAHHNPCAIEIRWGPHPASPNH